MRSMRIATALYLLLALPGLVFGWLLSVAPLGLPCEPTAPRGPMGILWPRTTGEPCAAIDYTILYWIAPAVALLAIGIGVNSARHALASNATR
jgi:hypothetical protein